MIIRNAKVFTLNGQFVEKDLVIRDGRIVFGAAPLADEEIVDAQGAYALPGLVDIHFHGAVGHDFCDADEAGLQAIADFEASKGVLAICPATMTFNEEILNGIMDVAAAHKNERGADLVGINMEGPYISPDKVGAQNPKYVMAADPGMFRRLQERSGGLIRLVDIAPEEPGNLDFIKACHNEVRISIAHTCADYDTAKAAFAAGKGAAFLSVEGAELLGCSLEGLDWAFQAGVRAVNLTWNYANALSGSCMEEPERGLSPQGRAFCRRMGELGMLVDVSHLSDAGFWDVAETVEGPFLATHSTARALCPHPRNLTDEMFRELARRGGVAGINLFRDFLGEGAGVEAVADHIEHFLDLGGAGSVALGGDLDGCGDRLPGGIAGVQDLEIIAEELLRRNYPEELLHAICFDNLMRVVNQVCTM